MTMSLNGEESRMVDKTDQVRGLNYSTQALEQLDIARINFELS